jgi:hypothetical protein
MDLQRQPEGLLFLGLALGLIATFMLIFNIATFPNLPESSLVGGVIFVVFNVALVILAVYLMTHKYRATPNPFLGMRGLPWELEDGPRVVDRSERDARRRLRRGKITRAHYERIVAYRQFVHGDLTRQEYLVRIARIADEEKVPPKSAP